MKVFLYNVFDSCVFPLVTYLLVPRGIPSSRIGMSLICRQLKFLCKRKNKKRSMLPQPLS